MRMSARPQVEVEGCGLKYRATDSSVRASDRVDMTRHGRTASEAMWRWEKDAGTPCARRSWDHLLKNHPRRLFLVGLVLTACATPARERQQGQRTTSDTPVGMLQVRFEDLARQRPLVTRIWYPAEPDTPSEIRSIAAIFVTRAVPDAPIAARPQKLPLVMLSHGTGGSTSSLVWMAERLAAHGYLVAAVEHFGNVYGNATPEGALAQWRRPLDLSRALDALLADPRFGPRIDPRRVGAAGLSSGGYTVIALAGGIYHPERMGTYCQENPSNKGCRFHAGARAVFEQLPDREAASLSYRDARFRAVFAIAPALGPAFSAEDLAGIKIPVGIVASARDEWVSLADNAEHFAKLIPGAELTVLPKGGHFTFLAECNAQGRAGAQDICLDLDPTVDRRAVHAQVGQVCLRFFDTHLR
jgi:predicted dienelactone hydrolase